MSTHANEIWNENLAEYRDEWLGKKDLKVSDVLVDQENGKEYVNMDIGDAVEDEAGHATEVERIKKVYLPTSLQSNNFI